ncbi:MAG: hypothetical protein Q8R54_06460 [Methylobacter sp.]|nr:hypothetical protein [Methylobacter sp.]
MNSIIKKTLLIGFALLLSACVHYPQRYSYYSGHDAYSSGYIMHRNHYGERPHYYDNGYFSHNQRHNQHNRDYDHHFNNGNRTGYSHQNNFGHRNHH